MLERAGAVDTRPAGLISEFGLQAQGYRLSDAQAQAILEMRLNRLTGLEQDKIIAEYQQLLAVIADLCDILARPERLTQEVRAGLLEILEQFGDERRTTIEANQLDVTDKDLIEPQDMVVTLSHSGYAKAQPVSDYRAQGRGGVGRAAAAIKDEDFIEKLFVAHSHDTLLCFSTRGQVYWLDVYKLPQAGSNSRGKPIVNLLALQDGEKISAVLPIKAYAEDQFVFMATRHGTVKKTSLTAFSNRRTSGIIAVDLREDDSLVDVALTDGQRDIMLLSSGGKAIRFSETEVSDTGRNSTGVRGIRLPEGEQLIALIVVDQGLVLTASENGYGKLTELAEFPVHGRGGQGVIALQTSGRNGPLVSALQVGLEHELMLISSNGTLVRTPVNTISVLGRNTQGVRLIKLQGERLVGVVRVEQLTDETVAEVAASVSAEGQVPSA
jgi:DNA gyrase subunit A